MPPEGNALAYFPGVDKVLSATVHVQHGISPAAFTITIAPQAFGLETYGTFQLGIGSTLLEWPGCRIAEGTVERNGGGFIWRFAILDRRWKWVGLGQISGRYNDRYSDGRLIEETVRTPQELLSLCFDALGESGYDVSAVPNDLRPGVDWEYARPADCIAQMCDEFGVRVVLGLDNIVRVQVLGEGNDLPLGQVLENSATYDPPERPDSIEAAAGPTWFQADVRLRAVGIAGNEEWRRHDYRDIDGLRYKPAGGWGTADFPALTNVAAEYRDIARLSVFRVYALTFYTDDMLEMLTAIYGEDGSIDCLNDFQCEISELDDDDDADTKPIIELKTKPPDIFGNRLLPNNSFSNYLPIGDSDAIDPTDPAKSTSLAIPPQHWRLDLKKFLVFFDHLVYANSEHTTDGVVPAQLVRVPAELRIRISFAARRQVHAASSLPTKGFIRHSLNRSYGSSYGTQPQFVLREDLALAVVPVYDASYGVSELTTNQEPLDDELNRYLDSVEQVYEVRTPQTVVYPGIVPIQPDGAIAHITYEIGPGGPRTIASRNTEHHHPGLVPYLERRELERHRKTKDDLKRLEKGGIKRRGKQ